MIKSWDDGMAGMRVGVRRRLTIRRAWPTVTAARVAR
ncbi:MAG: hypothetical protein ACT4NP_12165 [Pseudonocardiales bacterium]